MVKQSRNVFKDLVEEYKTDLKEEDLTKLLDARLRLFSNMLVIVPGMFISVAMIYQKIGGSIGPGIWEIAFYTAAGLYIFLLMLLRFTKIKPLQTQTKMIGEYVQARKLLKELKNESEANTK